MTENTTVSAEMPRIETTQSAQELCQRLLETSAELVDLLDRETAMLKQGKAQDIATVQLRKAALNALLTRDMEVFRRDAGFITTAAPGEIDSLKDRHTSLQKSINSNQDALVAMKAVSESLLHAMATKASERVQGPETYGSNAGVSTADPGRPAAISVNTVL